VQIAKGGCSGLHYEMSLDTKKSGDEVVQQDGVEFFIDPESGRYLRGSTLDFHDGLTGAGFQIVNPNAARTCGCGTSFELAPAGETAESAGAGAETAATTGSTDRAAASTGAPAGTASSTAAES
jgi:iron-sulfur cluster assembly accessory protein